MERSPLTRLPPELRNRIYELVLRSDDTIEIMDNGIVNGRLALYSRDAAESRILALTITCGKVRAECLQLFYSVNTFLFNAQWTLNADKLRCMHIFRRIIGDQNAAALRNVAFSTSYEPKLSGQPRQEKLATVMTQLYKHARKDTGCSYRLDLTIKPLIRGSATLLRRRGRPAVVVKMDMLEFEKSCGAAMQIVGASDLGGVDAGLMGADIRRCYQMARRC